MNLFLPTVQHRRLARWLGHNRVAKIITLILFAGVLLAIMAGIYQALTEGFRFINRDSSLGPVASLYAYELFLLVISLLTIGSSIITSLFLLFRKPEDGLVLATPSYPSLLWSRIRDVALSSSWPLLIFLLPALTALHAVFSVSVIGLLMALLGFGLYSLFLTLGTVCLLFGGALILGPHLRFSRLAGLMGLLSVAAVAALGAWSRSGNLFSFDTLSLQGSTITAIHLLTQRFHLLPSGLAAELLFHVQQGQMVLAATDLLTLGVLAGLGLLVTILVSSQYLRLWQQLQQGHTIAHTSAHKTQALHTVSPLLRSSCTPLAALVAKEVLLLVRDQQQLSWLLFLSGMWAVQAILISGITRHGSAGVPTTTIQLIEFLITLYFASTAVLRFVYPTFSTERRSAWLLACAPLDLRQVLIAKAAWFSVVFVLISVLISLVSLRLAGSRLLDTGASLASVTIAIVTVVALGIASSVYFPNFETDDPQVLSTSLPGLGLVAACLLYGVVSTVALQRQLAGQGSTLTLWAFGSLLLVAVLYYGSVEQVRKLEFVRVIS